MKDGEQDEPNFVNATIVTATIVTALGWILSFAMAKAIYHIAGNFRGVSKLHRASYPGRLQTCFVAFAIGLGTRLYMTLHSSIINFGLLS